jgi:hypothetical protein
VRFADAGIVNARVRVRVRAKVEARVRAEAEAKVRDSLDTLADNGDELLSLTSLLFAFNPLRRRWHLRYLLDTITQSINRTERLDGQ